MLPPNWRNSRSQVTTSTLTGFSNEEIEDLLVDGKERPRSPRLIPTTMLPTRFLIRRSIRYRVPATSGNWVRIA